MTGLRAEQHWIRISVTVDPTLLKAVDAYVQEHPELDRSTVFNTALLLWYSEEQEKAIARQHQAPQTEAAREEHQVWHRVQAAAVGKILRKA